MKYEARRGRIAVAQVARLISLRRLSPYPDASFSPGPATDSGAIPIISQFAGILNNRC
jgi:hypothetical protein